MEFGHWRHAISLICVVTAVTACSGVLATSAGAAEPFSFLGAFGPDGTSSSSFGEAGALAVDEADDIVYVLDQEANALFKFDLAGNPVAFTGSSPNLLGNELSGLVIGGGRGERQVAVDPNSHTIYLTGAQGPSGFPTAVQAFQADGDPAVFTAGPDAGTNEITGFESLAGVAVDSTGTIYMSTKLFPSEISMYRPTGALIARYEPPTNGLGNLAVASEGSLYINRTESDVRRYIPSETPISPTTTFTPEADALDTSVPYSIAVDPTNNEVYVVEGGGTQQVSVFDDEGGLQNVFGGPGEPGVLDTPYGIAVDGQGERAYVSQVPSGQPSQVKIFERELCICPPEIETTAAAEVTADFARLRALIRTNSLDSTYWFEFGPKDCEASACSRVPVAGGVIDGSRKPVGVSQVVRNLIPETTYHYRVVAENAESNGSPTLGPSRTFTTQGIGLGFRLSDSRVWEMVSPPKKFGGTIISSSLASTQAAVSGERLSFASLGSLFQVPAGNRSPEPSTVLAKRNSQGEWSTEDLTAPHLEPTLPRGSTEYKIFDPELTIAEMEPADGMPLSPLASEQTPYLRTLDGPQDFTPLITPANVPSGTEFGPNPDGSGGNNPVRIEGVTSDLSHVVVRSNRAPLIEGAQSESLYIWAKGQVEAVSKLPEAEGGGIVEGVLGSGRGSVRHAVSEDGSIAFWAPTIGNPLDYGPDTTVLPAIYVRDLAANKSFRIDTKEPGGGNGTGAEAPAFNGASADGSVVYFTDSQQLTEDASPEGRDLYRCTVELVDEEQACAEMLNISEPLAGSLESAEVLDQVSALSEDGSYVYFVARGVLDAGPNNLGDIAVAGKPNLYLWHEGSGVTFIAPLSERDYSVWGARKDQELGYVSAISAGGSPNGQYFAFTSERSLTGQENLSATGEGITQVFVYSAADDELFCASCNPTGSAATGELLPTKVFRFPPDPAGLWAKRWVAATLPEVSETEAEGRSLYGTRRVLNNGRVFFNSVDPLVPADSNLNWDVYQFEPFGVGGCTPDENGAAHSETDTGCVGLISAGTSEGDAGFLDSTPSGDDVFFATQGQLSILDTDTELDVYDARVGGHEAVLHPIEECRGEACQAAGGPPLDPTPASESFRGGEPLVKCRKGYRKIHRAGRTICRKKKGKRQQMGHHKRSGEKGRAGR